MSFYVTTPIYYVNDAPHIGHAYTTILADVLNRYHQMFGEETFFLTGTDEHGQKVQQTAAARGISPQQHCDEYVVHFQKIWKELDIQNDFFIRTTMDFHKKAVQACLTELYEKGEIYEGEYEGWYSVSEEMFYAEEELIDGKSPQGKEVVKMQEKNYFFRMSKYQERLIAYINDNPDFVQPKGKRSEVLGFLNKPLGDLCISRPKSRLEWGVELPFDDDFVTYVWFDALLNYTTALGYKQADKSQEQFNKFWPDALHLIGKDILTTHAVYWPTMLMALEVPLPKCIFAHGWWLTADDKKMSKSEGPVVAPLDMKNIVGVDGLRYFLMRGMNPAQDGQFSKELVLTRVNSELANNLGNLASRTIGLVAKHFASKVPDVCELGEQSTALKSRALETSAKLREAIEEIAPNRAIESVLELLWDTNKYLDSTEPWKTVKEDDKTAAAESLYCSLEVLRIVAVLLTPVMPSKCKELLQRLGWEADALFEDAGKWGLLTPQHSVVKGPGLFPRIDE